MESLTFNSSFMYEYNSKAIDRHIKNRTFSQRSLSESSNTSRPTVIRWIHGEDIYVSKLLRICNHYKIPLGDFIYENGLPVSSVYTNDSSQTEALQNLPKDQSSNVAEIMRYEEQMKRLKEEYESKISRMEKDFLERIGDVREASAEKWAKKNVEAVQAERKTLETKYEQRLKEQSDEIMKLREENAVLKSQLKTPSAKPYVAPDMLSESDSRNKAL